MSMVPRCSRVNEEVYHFETPLPSCRIYTDFQTEISRFEGYVKDVRDELLEIRDCVTSCQKEIREEQSYVKRVNTLIGEINNRIGRERAKKKPNTSKIARWLEDIAEAQRNIDGSNEIIAECMKSIDGCNNLRPRWEKEMPSRKRILLELRGEYKKGLLPDGTPKLCGSKKTVSGAPCAHPRQYMDRKWGPCHEHD